MMETTNACVGCAGASMVDGCADLCGGILLVLTADGTVLTINQGGCKLIGSPAAEIIGRNWFTSHVQPCSRERTRAEFARAARGVASPYYEYRVLTARGAERTIACHSQALSAFDGEPIHGIFSSGMDVTDRVRENQALRESEQRLAAILESAVDGIVTIDEDGAIESFNRACELMFDYRACEVISQKVSMLMKGWDQRVGVGRELTGMRKDGATFPLEIGVSETYLPDKRCIFTAVLKDLSARRQAEQELQEANQKLMVQTMFTQRLSALAAMAGGIAHELNQPLSSIRVYAQTLQSYSGDETTRTEETFDPILARIIAQVDRAAAIIDHMREFASESRSPKTRVVHLRELIQRVLELVGQQLRAHGIDFCNNVPAEAFALADGHRLEQVLINLVTNAKDSILERGKRDGPHSIRASASVAADTVELAITDTGGGVPAAVRDRLFEPFVTTKGPQRGTGLGLAICHGILQDYDAQIALSAPGPGGTTFTITFKGGSS